MWFGIICLIGIIGLILSVIFLAAETDPFALWLTIFFVSLGLVFAGGIGAVICQDIEASENTIVQEESIEGGCQYNYCPYCGKEINK
jgi:hypothetical protein